MPHRKKNMKTENICKIEWIIIPAENLELAKEFYSEVFGFKITPFSEKFVVFEAGNISGGLDQDLTSSGNGIGFSITVGSINECIEELIKFNCEILREPYELGPNAGYCVKFKDPNGNILELYSTSL
jgi:predicted enzyme related to lactoylglutathione lyase